MKKLITLCAALGCVCSAALADINVSLAPGQVSETVYITSIPIAEYAQGRNAVKTVLKDSVALSAKGHSFKTPAFPAFNILADNEGQAVFFTEPGDIVTAVVSTSPFSAKFNGAKLVEAMNRVDAIIEPYQEKLMQMVGSGTSPDSPEIRKLVDQLDADMERLCATSPDGTVQAYAAMSIDDPEKQIAAFKGLGEAARQSPIFPIVEHTVKGTEASLKAEKLQEGLKGQPAPEFSLPAPDGKMVSISQFRGKWVILDFWGSWCGWCIKGFPALKEAYKKYDGKLEIIGIDCGDSEDAWKNAIKKFQLPWVHVYNSEQAGVDNMYGIQGFPTKMIVDPQGKIVDITTGEDPSFFERLDNLMK